MFLKARAGGAAPRSHVLAALSEDGRRQAERVICALPGYQPTPLVALSALAQARGVAALHVKDEGRRFHLTSFKALGGAYAVVSMVLAEAGKRLGRTIEPDEIASGSIRAVARDLTFCCATDGNHGRSVAWGAQLAGATCGIFIHAGVSAGREAAMAALGAVMTRIDGSYDDSVALAAREADKNGWIVVSDTAWPGYEDIPLTVMQGYTVMAGEALDALAEAPTHIFVQAGVGGMAASVAAYARCRFGPARPKIVVVEPARAACLYESACQDRLVTIPHSRPTVMAMLECATPSPLGWEVLRHLADGYVTLDENEAIDAMRLLAGPAADDPAVVAGESGGTGLAGFLQCMSDRRAREHLGLDGKSRILVFNSEGATDPDIYRSIVGRAPDRVSA